MICDECLKEVTRARCERNTARAEAEKFQRALQSIASEPCASRLVSGRECDPGNFPCASCKAKAALK